MQIENGSFAVVCGWVIWDVPNNGWAQIPIIVSNVDQLIGAGSFYVSARVFDTVTPGTKIQDLIQDGNVVGGLYTGFSALGNEIDYADAPFSLSLNIKITEHTAQLD